MSKLSKLDNFLLCDVNNNEKLILFTYTLNNNIYDTSFTPCEILSIMILFIVDANITYDNIDKCPILIKKNIESCHVMMMFVYSTIIWYYMNITCLSY